MSRKQRERRKREQVKREIDQREKSGDRAERRDRVERICASLYTSVKNKIDHIF